MVYFCFQGKICLILGCVLYLQCKYMHFMLINRILLSNDFTPLLFFNFVVPCYNMHFYYPCLHSCFSKILQFEYIYNYFTNLNYRRNLRNSLKDFPASTPPKKTLSLHYIVIIKIYILPLKELKKYTRIIIHHFKKS